MSHAQTSSTDKITVPYVRRQKNKTPLVCLTAYNAYMAAISDRFCDIILVGDSVAMVIHGHKSTITADMEMMILHGKAVVKSVKKALVVVDMPFGSYESSMELAFQNAVRILKETGCDAVKLEGGEHIAPTVKYLVTCGIPVMGHIGLCPQNVLAMGGFKTQGKSEEAFAQLLKDAKAIEEAGAFAVVLEGMVEAAAIAITQHISIPTIGIGASKQCDGQILVAEDMLGLYEWTPKFVRRYGKVRAAIEEAIAQYSVDVKDRSFPASEETYIPINPKSSL